jgi:hypothetical protein
MIGDSKSFDELLQKLENGELTDQANRIRSFLCDEETFYNALQQNRKTNRPLLNIANEEGALLVQKGAELEVDIIKSVLQNAFPGIEKGFDYADKVNKWAELIRKTYNDPLSGAASYASGEAGDEIKNQILNALLELGMDETMADEMAGNLSVEILNQISSHDEELEELEKQETKQAETDSVEVDEDAEVIEEPTATKKPVSTITPTILTPTQESSIPQCDAMDYITVLSGHLTYEDVGDGCVYEAMVRNAHPQKNVYLAMHKVSGGIVTYKIDANKTWGTPFNMKAGNKNYSTDWFVAIFDTPECLDFYRGKSIDDFPSFGLNVATTNYPTCGN